MEEETVNVCRRTRYIVMCLASCLPICSNACGGGGGDADSGQADVVLADVALDLSGDPYQGDSQGEVLQDDVLVEDVGGIDQGKDQGVADAIEEIVKCTPKPPLDDHLNFMITGLKIDDPAEPTVTGVSEEAIVKEIEHYDSVEGDGCKTTFILLESRSSMEVDSVLPFAYEIPVSIGQRVHVFARREQGFEHRDMVFVVREMLTGRGPGNPLFFLHDAATTGDPPWYECKKMKPCPSAIQVYTECPAESTVCGKAVFPPVDLKMHGGLSSGEAVKPLEQGTATYGFNGHRYMNIKSNMYETMDCLDFPDRWTTAIIGHSVYASQCECHDSADCAEHEVCEPKAHRCVEDLCRKVILNAEGKNCKEGYICDAFTGVCEQPIPPPTLCKIDDDCGLDQVCNPEMRFCSDFNECQQLMGGCVQNDCVDMDCMYSCSALLGVCVECLADCECEIKGQGRFCDQLFTCNDCDVDKIGFSQENPSMFEFYELCVWKDGIDPEEILKAIDPTITCGGAGVFAGCDLQNEVGCHGDLEYVPGTKWISDGKWGQICDLSQEAFVTRFAGGHYL